MNKIIKLLLLMCLYCLPAAAQTYCNSQSAAPWQEWIAQVQLEAINNSSSKCQQVCGYSDFTNLEARLENNESYPISLHPGLSWAGQGADLYWAVWIDYNQNGDFTDAGEQVLNQANGNQILTSTIQINANQTGTTRMRIAAKKGSAPVPCESFAEGEVEDYTVVITAGSMACLNGNTSFQNGFSDWNNFGNTSLLNTGGFDDCCAMVIGPEEGGLGMANSIPVNPGERFMLTANSKITTAVFEAAIGIKFLDANLNPINEEQVVVNANAYQAYQVLAIAPGNAAYSYAWAYKRGDGGFQYVDDLCLQAVSGPVFTDVALTVNAATNIGLEAGDLFQYNINVKNEGQETVTSLRVKFYRPASVSYAAGNEFGTNTGTFTPYGEEVWEIDEIRAGNSAGIRLNLIRTSTTESIDLYAEVVGMNELDLDSEAGNGTVGIPNEDDEAVFRLYANLNAPMSNDFSVDLFPYPAAQGLTFIDQVEGVNGEVVFLGQESVAGQVWPNYFLVKLLANGEWQGGRSVFIDGGSSLRAMAIESLCDGRYVVVGGEGDSRESDDGFVKFFDNDLNELAPLNVSAVLPGAAFFNTVLTTTEGEIYVGGTLSRDTAIFGFNPMVEDALLLKIDENGQINVRTYNLIQNDFSGTLSDEGIYNIHLSEDGNQLLVFSRGFYSTGPASFKFGNIIRMNREGDILSIREVTARSGTKGGTTIAGLLPLKEDAYLLTLSNYSVVPRIFISNTFYDKNDEVIDVIFDQYFSPTEPAVPSSFISTASALTNGKVLFFGRDTANNVSITTIDPVAQMIQTTPLNTPQIPGSRPSAALVKKDGQIVLAGTLAPDNAPLSGWVLQTNFSLGGAVEQKDCVPTGGNNGVDIAVDLKVDNDRPRIYQAITYTVTVSNQGNQDASGLLIDFAYGAQEANKKLAFVSQTDPAYDNWNGIWHVGSLNAGQRKTFDLTLFVLSLASPSTRLIASIDQLDQNDINNTNDGDEVEIRIGGSSSNRMGFVNESNQINDQLIISPNPVQDELKLSVYQTQKESQQQLLIYNGNGRLMKKVSIQSDTAFNQLTIDVSDWPAGLYFIHLSNKQKHQASQRFIKTTD